MSASARTLAKSLVRLAQEYPEKIDNIVDEFVEFLSQNNLVSNSDIILRHLEIYKEEEQRSNTLQIQSTHPLTPAIEKLVRGSLNVDKDAPVITEIKDKSVSGVVAEYQGKVLDASMDTILNRLTQSLNEPSL